MMGLPWYLGNSRAFMQNGGDSWMWGLSVLFVPLAIWSLVWTGLALWYAAKREEKGWFIFFLLVHTAGIVELLYLIFVVHAFAQKKSSPRRRR